ncbi:MAG: hypothetical protein P8189_18215 [Anaerolineae bacterium]
MGRGIFHSLEGELAAREKSPGLSMSDLLALPDPLDRLCKWLLRQRQVSLADEPLAQQSIEELLDRGFVREVAMEGKITYRVRLAPTRKRQIPLDLWQALSDKVEGEEEGRP